MSYAPRKYRVPRGEPFGGRTDDNNGALPPIQAFDRISTRDIFGDRPRMGKPYPSGMSNDYHYMPKEPSVTALPQSDPVQRLTTRELFGETPEHHEKIYLAPENLVRGDLRRTFGNPTPVAIVGLIMAGTPCAVDLMGWKGAGGGTGNDASGTPAYLFFGGVLLLFSGVGEWVLGNTFSCVIFFAYGAFWLTSGAALIPWYAVTLSYKSPTDYYDSIAFFQIFMGLLSLGFAVCALRTNLVLTSLLFLFVLAFGFLAAADFYAANKLPETADTMTIAGGVFVFLASMELWYLWVSVMFDAVDFPISLPVGDLSSRFRGKKQKQEARRATGRV